MPGTVRSVELPCHLFPYVEEDWILSRPSGLTNHPEPVQLHARRAEPARALLVAQNCYDMYDDDGAARGASSTAGGGPEHAWFLSTRG